MADFSITLTVPDGKVNDLIDALNWENGQIQDVDGSGNPIMRDRTPAELRAQLKASNEAFLLDIFKRYKRHLHAKAPIDDDLDIS